MAADDGNKPKGRILEILEKKGGVPVGDIRPVNKRLRELEKAHEAGVPPVSGRQMCPQGYRSKWDKSGSEDGEGPGEDLLRGLKIGPSVIEVPVKKKPGEPGESLIDTRHPEPTTPEMDRYLSISPPGRPDLLPEFMRDKGASEAPSGSEDWERDIAPHFRELWSTLPRELKAMLEEDGRLDDKGRTEVVVRLFYNNPDPLRTFGMFDSFDTELKGKAYREAYGDAVRDAIEGHLKRMSGAAGAGKPGQEVPPSMLKCFGMEAPYIPGKGIRVSDNDKPASGFQPYRPPTSPEIERELDNFPLNGVQSDQDEAKRLQDALDSLEKEKGETPLRRALKKAFGKLGGTPFRPTQVSPTTFDPRTGQPGFSYNDKFRDPPPQHVMRKVQDMLDKDKRLSEEDKKAVISNIFHDAYWISPIFRMRPPHESLGDRVRQEVERHLARKAGAPKTALDHSDFGPPRDALRAYGSTKETERYYRDVARRLLEKMLRGLPRDMLDKDKRLTDSDKEAILDAVSSRQDEIGKDGKSLGDITREEVERHLARKAGAPKTALQIDAEAAVRILKEFCSDMAVLEQQKKDGWLSPIVDETNRTEVNGWSLPTFKSVTIYWHSEAEVLESVRVIPESRLDNPIPGDSMPGGMTVRELLNEVARSSSFESVKNAAMEKLQ